MNLFGDVYQDDFFADASAPLLATVRAGNMRVEDILKLIHRQWDRVQWHVNETPQPHEARLLHLDSARARRILQWLPVWDFPDCLKHTLDWYRRFLSEGSRISREQLAAYV